MATLHEYFVKDGSRDLTQHETWQIRRQDQTIICDVVARLHFDFHANAKYVSFFIPATHEVECPQALLLNRLSEILEWPTTKVGITSGFENEKMEGRDLIFTGRVYFYSEIPLPQALRDRLASEANNFGHTLIFRSAEYMNARNRFEKPLAFISHDSRDKSEIAEPLALQLQKFMCPVWYDEYSLKVGDSLRDSIENGIRQCSKCILVLTPNFLKNNGWARREYDSIFTRELVEKQRVILPVWHNVSPNDLYNYSPILADRVGAQWSEGVEEVARKLLRSIND